MNVYHAEYVSSQWRRGMGRFMERERELPAPSSGRALARGMAFGQTFNVERSTSKVQPARPLKVEG